jgi:hypothetical protein
LECKKAGASAWEAPADSLAIDQAREGIWRPGNLERIRQALHL